MLNGSATQSGLTTTLLSIPGLFMGPIYSRMIANKGSARGVLTIGMILRVMVHAAFIFILSPSTDLMVIYALMIIAGFYQSAHVCTMTTAPQIQLAADKRTYGNAMIQVTMALGSLLHGDCCQGYCGWLEGCLCDCHGRCDHRAGHFSVPGQE